MPRWGWWHGLFVFRNECFPVAYNLKGVGLAGVPPLTARGGESEMAFNSQARAALRIWCNPCDEWRIRILSQLLSVLSLNHNKP